MSCCADWRGGGGGGGLPAFKGGKPNTFKMTGVDYGSARMHSRRENDGKRANMDSSPSDVRPRQSHRDLYIGSHSFVLVSLGDESVYAC